MYGVEGDGGSVGGVDEESGGGHVDGQADGGGEQDGDAGFDDDLRGECGFGYAAMQCGGDFEPSAAYEQVSDGEGDECAAGGQDACGALPVEGLSVEAVAFGGVELAEGGCIVAGGFRVRGEGGP